jgi:hypothetical protein
MKLGKMLTAMAAALLLAGVAGAGGAQGIPPMLAAQLNAGTAQTGIGLNGRVGAGISAVVPEVMELVDVEVAGVQLGYDIEGGSPTISTLGLPHQAALLNAGTAWTGLGFGGLVGAGIFGPRPTLETGAQSDLSGYIAD